MFIQASTWGNKSFIVSVIVLKNYLVLNINMVAWKGRESPALYNLLSLSFCPMENVSVSLSTLQRREIRTQLCENGRNCVFMLYFKRHGNKVTNQVILNVEVHKHSSRNAKKFFANFNTWFILLSVSLLGLYVMCYIVAELIELQTLLPFHIHHFFQCISLHCHHTRVCLKLTM